MKLSKRAWTIILITIFMLLLILFFMKMNEVNFEGLDNMTTPDGSTTTTSMYTPDGSTTTTSMYTPDGSTTTTSMYTPDGSTTTTAMNTTPSNAFNPKSDIKGCDVWWDGSDPNGDGIPPTDGALIKTWKNKSDNKTTYDAIATTEATYSASKKALLFKNSFYKSNYKAGPTKETCFIVFNKKSDNPTGSSIIIGSSRDNGRELGTKSSNVFAIRRTNDQWQAEVSGVYNNSTILSESIINTNNKKRSVSLNGDSKLSSIITTGLYETSAKTDIGGELGKDYQYSGYIMEILIYNDELNDADRKKVEGYLAWKWGINCKLPDDHPYYLAAPTRSVPATTTTKGPTSTSTTLPRTSMSTTQGPTSTSTTLPRTSMSTTQGPTSTSSTLPRNSMSTTQGPTSTSSTLPRTSMSTTQGPTSTSSTLPRTSTSTTLPRTSMSTTQGPTSTSTTRPPTSTSTTRPPTSTSTTRPPTSTSTTRPPTSTSTTRPPTSMSTTQGPTSTSTTLPRNSTSTTQGPTSTSTTPGKK